MSLFPSQAIQVFGLWPVATWQRSDLIHRWGWFCVMPPLLLIATVARILVAFSHCSTIMFLVICGAIIIFVADFLVMVNKQQRQRTQMMAT